jgi:hypothetical protein
MSRTSFAVTLALALALPAAASADKLKKPSLQVRAMPRFGFSPVNILVVAELVGGEDSEEFYCPEVVWEWDDGGKSVQEPDCEPYDASNTAIERRFTAEHEYKQAGSYRIRATLKRTGRAIASQSVRVTVRPGLGDRSDDLN